MKAFLTKHGEVFIISTLAVFAPIKEIIIVAALAVIVDFILGIIAAKKRGDEIKSSKMGVTISKLLLTQTAILMGFLIQNYLLGNAFPLVNWIAGVVGTKEIFSILESLDSISGNKLFKDILTKLGSINSVTEKKEDVKKE